MSQFIPIPKRYRQNTKGYHPKFLKGHAHSLYFNSDQLLTNREFGGLRLDLYDASGEVDTDVAELVMDEVNGDGYRWYTETLILDNDLARKKDYFLAVSDQSGFELRNISLTADDTFSSLSEDATPLDIRFNAGGDRMFILGGTNKTIYQYKLTTNWDVTTASYDSVSFLVSGEDTDPKGFHFNNTGTILFMVGATNDSIYKYDLSTAWDLSGVVYSGDSYVLDASVNLGGVYVRSDKMFVEENTGIKEYILSDWDITTAYYTGRIYDHPTETAVRGFTFSPNGDKMYLCGITTDDFLEVKLPERWKLESVTNEGVSSTAVVTTSSGLTISNDGTKVFLVNSTNGVDVFNISSGNIEGWDMSTLAYASVSKLVSAQATSPLSLEFNKTGTKMYVLDASSDAIYEYDLSTAFLVSSATYNSVSLDVSGQDTTPYEIRFSNDGKRLFMTGTINDTIHQYNLGVAYHLESAVYSGISYFVGEAEGQTYSFEFDKTGTVLYIAFSDDDDIIQYSLSTPYDLTTVKITSKIFTVTTSITINDLRFNPDRSKMYLVDVNNGKIEYFTLSTKGDVTTAVSVGTVSIAEEAFPRSIAFNSDGTKVFLIGTSNDTVYEYTLDQSSVIPITMVSNCFEVIDETDLEDYAYLQITNSEDIYGIGYEDSDIEQDIFIDANVIELSPELKIDEYKEISTGITRNLGSTIDLVHILETYHFDQEAHEMMMTAVHHGSFKINGKEYTPKNYEIAPILKNATSKGKLEMKDVQVSMQGKFN